MIFIFQKIIASFTRHRKRRAIYNRPKPIYRDFTGHYSKDGNFLETFYSNLRRTILWTQNIVSTIKDTSHVDYVRILRTTNPLYEGRPFYLFNDSTKSASGPNIPFNYHAVLSDALELRQDSDLPISNMSDLGKILRFQIDVTIHDGAPAAELGFVDESDIPPIDTWFYITKIYLYCWIPTLFINKMQDAVDVEFLDSYEWVEKIDPALNGEIEKKIMHMGTTMVDDRYQTEDDD
jgi:hypothetical protein